MKTGAFIIPTGIGASIGGFAGDGSKWARKLSKYCRLIVNPNVVNAACFSGITENMFYTEGFIIDEFFKGNCMLQPSCNNKIGVIFDKAISKDVLNIHINTINAVKTVYDIKIEHYDITKEEVGVTFFIDDSGISTGNVHNLNTIKKSTINLINKGCTAIAIVCNFPEDQGDDYENGIGVDPVGGVEAIISHYISKEFRIPCAHAPAFNSYDISTNVVDARCSAEFITPTFLPCILLGLNQAPLITNNVGISINELDFLAVPYNALGSIPTLEAHKKNIPIYAIKENQTVLNVNPVNFNIECKVLDTYEELVEIIKNDS